MANKYVNPTKVVTGICTFSYLNCWEPKAIQGGKPKYGCFGDGATRRRTSAPC